MCSGGRHRAELDWIALLFPSEVLKRTTEGAPADMLVEGIFGNDGSRNNERCLMNWRLVFFAFVGAVLLGYSVCGVCFVQATEPDGLAKTAPKPANQKRQFSEDIDSNGGSGAVNRGGGRFARDVYGVISDKQTGLQWYMGPNEDMTWRQAQSWTQSLSAGGGGWRMPTVSELRGLHGTGEYTPTHRSYSVKIAPIFQLGACCPWSSDTRDVWSAWLFDFDEGVPKWRARGNRHDGPPLAVRSR